jgi:hypothetical protein
MKLGTNTYDNVLFSVKGEGISSSHRFGLSSQEKAIPILACGGRPSRDRLFSAGSCAPYVHPISRYQNIPHSRLGKLRLGQNSTDLVRVGRSYCDRNIHNRFTLAEFQRREFPWLLCLPLCLMQHAAKRLKEVEMAPPRVFKK